MRGLDCLHLLKLLLGCCLIYWELTINGKPEWLQIPSEYWAKFEDYRKIKILVSNLPFVNEGAERAMAMMKRYVDEVKDGKDKQDLIQLIQGFRQKVTDFAKDSLKIPSNYSCSQ